MNEPVEFEVQVLEEESDTPNLYVEPHYELQYCWNMDRLCWEDANDQPPAPDKKIMRKEEYEERQRAQGS